MISYTNLWYHSQIYDITVSLGHISQEYITTVISNLWYHTCDITVWYYTTGYDVIAKTVISHDPRFQMYIHVYTYMPMYIRVCTWYIRVCTRIYIHVLVFECTYMYRSCTYMYIHPRTRFRGAAKVYTANVQFPDRYIYFSHMYIQLWTEYIHRCTALSYKNLGTFKYNKATFANCPYITNTFLCCSVLKLLLWIEKM